MHRFSIIIIIAILFINGCAPATEVPPPTSTALPTLTATTVPTITATQTPRMTLTPRPTLTATKPPSLTMTPLAEGRVIIKETDGLPVTGTAYGHGETAVILASVGGMSESQWAVFAKFLAENDFTVLAISSPDSQGDTAVLVKQAIEFLRNNGYRRIVCAGASNGASGCAFNLKYPEITGLLLITYHGAANLSKVTLPKLFIAGEEANPWRETTEAGFNAAGEPKSLIIVPDTLGNGPSLLEMDQDIKMQVLDFLKKCNGL
ncbi:MAG: alpha/beta hydrolase [Anaerolineales bacterium]|nr:alpha/beta hydrolase [Anaerolineales bacterium]